MLTQQGGRSVALPDGFVVRPPRPDEAEAVSELHCACDIADTGEPDWSLDDTHADWARLGFDLARDARVIVAPGGRLAAYTDVHARPDAVEIAVNTHLHPDFRRPDLEIALIDLAESLALKHAPLTLRWIASPERGRILEERGWQPVRWLWRMRRDLAGAPPEPDWPSGFTVRQMAPEDEQATYAVIETAFQRPDRAPVAFDEWRRYIVEREDFDRTLAFVAVRDGEIAGAAMCLIFDEMREGWVRQLAVGAKHRGLGLGRALLLHAFGEFYRRGMQRVGLGVHADNPSATKLYLGAGMYAQQKYIQYHHPAA